MKKLIAIILTVSLFSCFYADAADRERKERKSKEKESRLELLKKELVSGADTLTNEFLDSIEVKKDIPSN